MLLRCKLFRAGGTHVELGKGKTARKYHFKGPDKSPRAPHDDPAEDHVADVTDKADIATFLAIPEGYEVDESELKKPAGAAAVKAAEKAETDAAAAEPAAVKAAEAHKNLKSLKKPDLIKRIVGHPKFSGKPPHGTTPTPKLIAQLEALEAESKATA